LNSNGFSAIKSYSSDNYFVRNNIKNNYNGINLIDGDNNTIMYNYFIDNQNEAIIINSPYNTIFRNNIIENNGGIFLGINATNNVIKQNNFIENIYHADLNKAKNNQWDQNYWDDWIGIKIPFLNFLPKIIISKNKIIPRINFDLQPSNKIYLINNYPIAVMNTSIGVMTFVLYTDKMPITTDNFIKLADINFFENIVFHRVINDFVIQGGGYYANGTNKRSPFGTIKLETHPDILHVDGAISMARTMMPNSATSQFFICDGSSPHLDGNYAAFGVIIDGLEVLREIAEVETTSKYGMDDWPVEDVIINSINIEYL
jgi:peptidyl-prolyl cis-trans isomerase B (cyclophilin B)